MQSHGPLRPYGTNEPRTIVVLGCPRGGTSAVSGVLHHSGIHMGSNLGHQYEDASFKHFLKDRKETSQREAESKRIEAVKQRNLDHGTWGFKSVNVVYYFDAIRPYLRNPVFLAVTRDPLEISQSSAKHDGKDWSLRLLEVAINHTGRVFQTIESHADIPTLLFSIRELQTQSEQILGRLEQHVGHPINTDRCLKFLAAGSYQNPALLD